LFSFQTSGLRFPPAAFGGMLRVMAALKKSAQDLRLPQFVS
jgi:hypothetical protein